MRKMIILLAIVCLFSVQSAFAGLTPVYAESAQTLSSKTLSDAGAVTFDGGPSVDGSASNLVDVTMSATGTENSNLRVISGKSAGASGDDIGIQVVGSDTGGTAVTYCDINVDLTDADTGTEDATVTVAIPVAGSLTTELTIDSTGITSAGDVSGATIGGITEASLLDKTAAETVSGSYTFQDPIASSVPVLQTNAAAITVTEAATGDNTVFLSFAHESNCGLGLAGGTFTNVFKIPITINGTNYSIPVIPAL